MNPLSKKFKEEWAFFINPKTNKIQYNEKCNLCVNECKQNYKAEIVHCKHYEKEIT